MPLTLPEYTDLWNDLMLAGFGQGGDHPQFPGVPFPNYVEYFDRDNQLEDYLDIFRGRNTRAGAVAGAVGENATIRWWQRRRLVLYPSLFYPSLFSSSSKLSTPKN